MTEEITGKLILNITLPSDDQTTGQMQFFKNQKFKQTVEKENISNEISAINSPNNLISLLKSPQPPSNVFQRKLRAKSAVIHNTNFENHQNEPNILQHVQCFDLKDINDSLSIPYRCSPRPLNFRFESQKRRPTTAGCINIRKSADLRSRISTANSTTIKQNNQLKPNVIDINQIFNSFIKYPLKCSSRQPIRLGFNNFSYLSPKIFDPDRQINKSQDIIHWKRPTSSSYDYYRKFSSERMNINGVHIQRIFPANKYEKT